MKHKTHILNRYIFNCIKMSKFRNIMMLLTIALTTTLFTVIFILGVQSSKVMQNEEARRTGLLAEGWYDKATEKEYNAIKSNQKIKEISYNVLVGWWDNEKLANRSTEIRWAADEQAAAMMYSKPEVGRMPKKSDEILVDTYVLKAFNLPKKLNQKVDMSFSFLNKKYNKSFTIVGYYPENKSSIASEVYISFAYMKELYRQIDIKNFVEISKKQYYGAGLRSIMYNIRDKSKLSEEYCRSILEESGIKTEKKESYANPAYIGNSLDSSSLAFLGICCVIVMLAGYLTIYNIFQISVYKDIAQYGILNMIGATKKHFAKIIRMQSLILSVIAIPIGLVIGHFAGMYFLPKFMRLSVGKYADAVGKVSIEPGIYLISALLVFVTVAISCRKPAKTAAGVTPVEAVRFDVSCNGNVKTKKSSKRPTIAFLAYENVFKDKKKAILTIMSMTMSCVLFMCVFSFANSFSIEKYVGKTALGDVQLLNKNWNSNNPEISKDEIIDYAIKYDVYQEVKNVEGVKDAYKVYYKSDIDKASKSMIQKMTEYLKQGELDESDDTLAEVLSGKKSLSENRYFISEGLLDDLKVVKGKIDKEKFLSGKYVIEARTEGNKNALNYCNIGDKISMSYPDITSKSIQDGDYKAYTKNLQTERTVMAIVDIPYNMFPTYRTSNAFITISSLKDLKTIGLQSELTSVILDVDSIYSTSVNDWADSYISKSNLNMDYVSKKSMEKNYEGLVSTVKIIGGGLSFIVALIGILNYANTFITGIISRRKEFGMLRSIGTTQEQLKELLLFENMYQVAYISVLGIVIGTGSSYLCIQLISNMMDFFVYRVAIVPIIFEIALFIVIGVALSMWGYRLNKGSIVEAIRE